MFRKDFVWGVASSAYQVEGRDKNDGAGTCIWDTFTEEGRTFEHHNAYVSADDMHRYKEDYALMRELGVKAYRFSVSWARLMPEGTGRVNEKAVALFLDRKIRYLQIPEIIRGCMENHKNIADPSVEEILKTEQETYEFIKNRW